MSPKKRILFIAENVTLAHVARLLVLASSIQPNKNYQIIFATGGDAKKLVEESGFEYHSIPTLSSNLFIKRLAKGERIFTTKELKISAQSDLKLFEAVAPDIVVGDFRISLGISTKISKIPYISIVNAHWSPYSVSQVPFPEHPMSSFLGVKISQFIFKAIKPLIFKYHSLPFNTVRKFYNLETLPSLHHIYSFGQWTLYPDIPELAPTSQLPDNHTYIGPIIWSPDTKLPEWWQTVCESDLPIIYLTLGSSGNIKIIDLLLSILQKIPVTVVIASANRFNQIKEANNIYCSKFIPGEKIAEKAALVICSGGSATAYQALAQGTPILGFPSNTDQHFTMNAIVKSGAGLSIRVEQAKKQTILSAINKLLQNAEFKKNATRLKKDFSNFNTTEIFQNFLDKINY